MTSQKRPSYIDDVTTRRSNPGVTWRNCGIHDDWGYNTSFFEEGSDKQILVEFLEVRMGDCVCIFISSWTYDILYSSFYVVSLSTICYPPGSWQRHYAYQSQVTKICYFITLYLIFIKFLINAVLLWVPSIAATSWRQHHCGLVNVKSRVKCCCFHEVKNSTVVVTQQFLLTFIFLFGEIISYL